MPQHPMKDKQEYFVTLDDVAISTQYMLFSSLISFSKTMNDNKQILDGDDLDQKLDIPVTENDVFEKILIDYKNGDSKILLDILEECQNKLNKYTDELGISDPEEIPQGILTRDKRRVMKIEELFDIHSSFPIELSSITSRFGEGLINLAQQFKNTHTLVYDNTVTKRTFESEMFVSDQQLENYELPIISVSEMYKKIDKYLNNEKDTRIITANPDVIRDVLDNDDYEDVMIIRPRVCQYLGFDDEVMRKLAIAQIW